MCSDHLSPWSERQGHSAFAWSWLGAALQSTSLPFGVVNAPGQRYHPVIIAQAIGTLGAMYEGRFWAALGTGENSNEHVTGGEWMRKDLRNARLRECVDIIRALLAGEEVTHDGLVTVDRAKVWTRPEIMPKLIGPAITPQTASWVAEWADGFATIEQPPDGPADLDRQLPRRGRAGAADPADPPLLRPDPGRGDGDRVRPVAQQHLCPTRLLGSGDGGGLRRRVESVEPRTWPRRSSSPADPAEHAQHLADLLELGFDEIYLHHVGQTQTEFIDVFGEHVLPQLNPTPKAVETP